MNKGERGCRVWLTFATCFMFFLYAPLELYFTNKNEFWYDCSLLAETMFCVFLIVFSLICLILFLAEKYWKQLYDDLIILEFAVFVCAYIQGNFLAKNLPPLDGNWIEWNEYPAERLKSIALWVSVTAVLFYLGRKKKNQFYKAVKYVSVFASSVLFVTLISVGILNDGFTTKPDMSVTEENQFKMSEDENFIILLLDAVDAKAMQIAMEEHPEYRETMEDFTFFSDAMGTYAFTKCSIPYIISGEWFENKEDFEEYSTKAYMNSPLIRTLYDKEYEMNLYEADVILNDNDFYIFDNILPNERGVSSWSTYVRWSIQMVGFKYAPFDLKRICFVNPAAFKTLRIPPAGCEVFTDSNKSFYDNILNSDIEQVQERQFKFIHIEGAHVPFQYDENVDVIENGTYMGNLEASMTITKAYLEKLKECGVYDNSIIIVMADHGYNWVNTDDTLNRQNPIFFVKGKGEKHELYENAVPVSWEDLQQIYSNLLAHKQSIEVCPWAEGESRVRRYLYYEYNKEEKMYEYIQKGNVRNYETFEVTGNIFEAAK